MVLTDRKRLWTDLWTYVSITTSEFDIHTYYLAMSTSVHIQQSLAHTKISQDKPHSRTDVCDQQRLINPSQIVNTFSI